MADLEAHGPKPTHAWIQTLSSANSTHEQPKPIQRPSTLTWIIVCAAILTGSFLYGLDNTIAADVQASVYQQFHDIEKLAWVGVGFPMGSVSILLLIGTLYGLFDSKWLASGFFAAFEVGSALCGAAPNINVLIVGRVIAGMGGAGMYIGALTYFAAFTTVKQRPLYNAGIGLCWGIGAILGPVIGGAFSVNHSATWRWAFYINLPLAAAFAPAYLFCFPHNDPRPELSFRSKLTQVDWIGALLNACAFVFFVIAVTFSGSSWAWNSGVAITMWVLSGASLLGSVLQQGLALGTSRPNRLFPAHLLKSRTMLLLFFATAASCSATAMCLYYIPLLFQFTRGDSALKAAVRLLPFIAPYVFAILLNGALLPITKRYTPWYITGGICILIAGVLLHNITPSTHTAAIYGFEVLLSIGTGVSFQVAYAVAASKLRHRDMPAAIGFVNVAQIGSIAIVLTIAGAIFQNRGYTNLRRALAGYNLPEETLRAALAGADSALAGAFDAKMEGLVVQAVVKTISTEFILVIVAGALMTISALFMKWERLNLEAAAAGA